MENEKKIAAKPSDTLTPADRQKLAEFQNTILEDNEVRKKLRGMLAEIIGPLTVRERWDLLENIGLKNVRTSIPLEGSAANIAAGIVDCCCRPYMYPDDILLVYAILTITESDELSDRLDPYLSRFVQNQE